MSTFECRNQAATCCWTWGYVLDYTLDSLIKQAHFLMLPAIITSFVYSNFYWCYFWNPLERGSWGPYQKIGKWEYSVLCSHSRLNNCSGVFGCNAYQMHIKNNDPQPSVITLCDNHLTQISAILRPFQVRLHANNAHNVVRRLKAQ